MGFLPLLVYCCVLPDYMYLADALHFILIGEKSAKRGDVAKQALRTREGLIRPCLVCRIVCTEQLVSFSTQAQQQASATPPLLRTPCNEFVKNRHDAKASDRRLI